jgi:hypothetical protein
MKAASSLAPNRRCGAQFEHLPRARSRPSPMGGSAALSRRAGWRACSKESW